MKGKHCFILPFTHWGTVVFRDFAVILFLIAIACNDDGLECRSGKFYLDGEEFTNCSQCSDPDSCGFGNLEKISYDLSGNATLTSRTLTATCGGQTVRAMYTPSGGYSCLAPPDDDENDAESQDTGTEISRSKVELFHWWTDDDGSAAFQEFVDLYNADFPDVDIVNLSLEESDINTAKARLDERIADRNPPDAFHLSPAEIEKWVNYEGELDDNRLAPLDDLFAEQKWEENFPSGILDSLRLNDSYYGVPVTVFRSNTLFFNKHLIDEPPVTLEDFFAMAQTLLDAGVTPLATSANTWQLEFIFSSVLAGSAGISYHYDFFSGDIDLSDSAHYGALATAVDDFISVMEYTNSDATELSWDEAAELLFDGEAAMYVDGSWANALFQSKGWEPGTDYDVSPALGSEGSYMYALEIFSLCDGANNPVDTRNFFKTLGSPEAQAAFNARLDTVPVLSGVDISDRDSVTQKLYTDLASSTVQIRIDTRQLESQDQTGEIIGFGERLLDLYNGAIGRNDVLEWIVENYGAI